LSAYENVTTHEGDLIINGTQTLVIENCTYIQNGDISVANHGKLVMRNCDLVLNQTSVYEYALVVRENAMLNASNVRIYSDFYYDQRFEDQSEVNFVKTYWNATQWRESCVAWTYGYGASLRFQDCSGVGNIWVSTTMLFINSSTDPTGCILTGEESDVLIKDSTAYAASIRTRFSEVEVESLIDPDVDFFNTFENVTIMGGPASNLTVTNSNLYFGFQLSESKLRLNNTQIDFAELWKSEAWIRNCSGPRDGLALYLDNSSATIYDSQISFINSGGNSEFVVQNSSVLYGLHFVGGRDRGHCKNCTIDCVYAQSFQGTVLLNGVAFAPSERGPFPIIRDSSFEIVGNITFPSDQYVSDWSGYGNEWKDSRIVREYDVIILNGTAALGNAVLKLYDSDGNLVWNGLTDDSGKASFGIGFSDVNYTGHLELEAIKEDWSKRVNVTLFSRTPIQIPVQRGPTDLNADGKVNILDITVVAAAYNTVPGDEKWNAAADLDKNGQINILDVTMVAKDYGSFIGIH
jgi:hypothetical protein